MKYATSRLLSFMAVVVVCGSIPSVLSAQWFQWYHTPDIEDSIGYAQVVTDLVPGERGALVAGSIYGSPVRAFAQFRRMDGEAVWSVILPLVENPSNPDTYLNVAYIVNAAPCPEGGWWLWVYNSSVSGATVLHSISVRYHVGTDGTILGEERVNGFGTIVLPDGGLGHSNIGTQGNPESRRVVFTRSNIARGGFDSVSFDMTSLLREFRGHPTITSWKMSSTHAVMLVSDELTYESAVVTMSLATGAVQVVRLDGPDDPLHAFDLQLLSDGSPVILAHDISWGPEHSSNMKLLWLGAEIGTVQRIDLDVPIPILYSIAGELASGELVLIGYEEHIISLLRVDGNGTITGRLPLYGVSSQAHLAIGPEDRLWLNWSNSYIGLIAEAGTITSVSEDGVEDVDPWGLDLTHW